MQTSQYGTCKAGYLTIVTVAYDEPVCVWDVMTGRCIKRSAPMDLLLNVWLETTWLKGSNSEAPAPPMNAMTTGGSDKASQNTMLMSQRYICQ